MTTAAERGWLLALLGALGIGGLAVAASASAEPAPPSGGGPTTTLGPGTVLQQRPIPALGGLSASGRTHYVSTMQQELSTIGYPVGATGNEQDAATVAAVNRFMAVAENAALLRAYGWGFGGGADADLVALMNAIDDIARHNTGADDASDARTPVASSAGLGPFGRRPAPMLPRAGLGRARPTWARG